MRNAFQLRANEQGTTLAEIVRIAGESTPLGRLTPLAQIADAAVLMASDLAAGMTATAANATGGAQFD